VSVATGIALFEALRQRRAKAGAAGVRNHPQPARD
jgi:hypothetical protein